MARKNEKKESEEVIEKKVEAEDIKFPIVGGNGRFQMVPFKDGFVVYNPVGQRATGVVGEVYAKDMVTRSNRVIGIKG